MTSKCGRAVLAAVIGLACGLMGCRDSVQLDSLRPATDEKAEALNRPIWTNQFGMSFVDVRPGSFVMGSSNGAFDEMPMHSVTLSQGYLLGKSEVTRAQWAHVMGDSFIPEESDHPVSDVSWDQVQEFIDRINRLEGTDTYRLPTEAEWEYACTSGGRRHPATDAAKVAWYGANSGGHTHPVGNRAANPWGFHDMLGNVAEWCQDRYAAKAYEFTVTTDPQGPPTGNARVIRGGSCISLAWYCRVSVRAGAGRTYRDTHVGFRLARSLP